MDVRLLLRTFGSFHIFQAPDPNCYDWPLDTFFASQIKIQTTLSLLLACGI